MSLFRPLKLVRLRAMFGYLHFGQGLQFIRFYCSCGGNLHLHSGGEDRVRLHSIIGTSNFDTCIEESWGRPGRCFTCTTRSTREGYGRNDKRISLAWVTRPVVQPSRWAQRALRSPGGGLKYLNTAWVPKTKVK